MPSGNVRPVTMAGSDWCANCEDDRGTPRRIHGFRDADGAETTIDATLCDTCARELDRLAWLRVTATEAPSDGE